MLPIKKIYIDSRNRTADSISSSNFKIEIDHTLQMPDNAVFFVTDICMPHVFQLIESGVNDRLYYKYSAPRATNQYSINAYYIIITLPSGGQPSGTLLASQIQTAMNANVDPESAISFVVTWDSSQYSINVSTVGANTSFKFLTEAEIVFNAIWWNGQFDPSNTKSANDILKIDTPLAQTNSFISDFIQLQPINNVYITSPTLGSFDTIASFSNNVIRKVPITVPYGYMVVDQSGTNNDFLDCSKQTLRTIEFHFKDSRGRFVNMHGLNVSFSLVFNKFNMN